MATPSLAVRRHQCAAVEDGAVPAALVVFLLRSFFSSEDGTRIDERNILQINDHDVLCSYFVCVFVFSFRLPFGVAL